MAFNILLFPLRRAGARRPGLVLPAVSDPRVNVLVLGGSPESLLIVEGLARRADVHVVTSIVGREDGTNAPAEGDVRIGGFADAQALADFVRERRIELLIDAADPFQPQIRGHAAETAVRTGVTRLVFQPACFEEEEDDDVWIRVTDLAEAADLLPGLAARAMLELSPADVDAFSRVADVWFLLRGPAGNGDTVPLASFERLPARMDASVEQEQTVLRQHAVQVVVTREPIKASGTPLLRAARALKLPVVMLERPRLPPSDVVSDVGEVLAWVNARLAELPDRRSG